MIPCPWSLIAGVILGAGLMLAAVVTALGRAALAAPETPPESTPDYRARTEALAERARTPVGVLEAVDVEPPDPHDLRALRDTARAVRAGEITPT